MRKLATKLAETVGLKAKPAVVETARKKARAAHSYRGARRNFARLVVRAGLAKTMQHATVFASSKQSIPFREFVAVNPTIAPRELPFFFEGIRKDLEAASQPAEAPKAKKPRAPRKPAAPKDATAQAAPKAPRKTAATKPSGATAKPKAAPRKRAPAAA